MILKTFGAVKKTQRFLPVAVGVPNFHSTATDRCACPKDYAPKIAENGLDPTCGHLAKGSWLGGAGGYTSRFRAIITPENYHIP